MAYHHKARPFAHLHEVSVDLAAPELVCLLCLHCLHAKIFHQVAHTIKISDKPQDVTKLQAWGAAELADTYARALASFMSNIILWRRPQVQDWQLSVPLRLCCVTNVDLF